MIQFRDVTKVYRKTGTALEALDLSFDEGEFAFITGPSGAGKTTLLKLLYAAERPSSGEVLIEGRAISRLHPRSVPWLRRNMGVVIQDFRLLPRRTVGENVALALEVCGLKQAEIQQRVHAALDRVGLGDMVHRLPTELSGGEQQRTAIARAIVNEPSIILADEPTGNLDQELSFDIMGLLVDLCHEKRATILVATHDRNQLDAWDVREVQLADGRLVGDVLADEKANGTNRRPTTEVEEAEAGQQPQAQDDPTTHQEERPDSRPEDEDGKAQEELGEEASI